MSYALIHYPAFDPERINQLRRKYDPQFNLIAPHITIMFPVPDSIGEHRLVSHTASILRHWKPFPIHLKGLQKSWDECLFLTLVEGEADVISLHDDIYTGLLSEYRSGGIPYVPHVTLGVFTGKSDGYIQALKEAGQLNLDYKCMLDKLHLVKVSDNRSQIIWGKEFLL